MPNRIIKESICVSEQIDELGWFEEVFFYRLLVNCDDYGCMDAREKVLAAKLFPLKTVKASVIDDALERLANIGLIGLYEVDEKPYLKVLKWADHQRVRVSKHKYPEPADGQVAATRGKLRRDAANGGKLRPESNPIQSESNPNPNTNPNPNPNPTRAGAREESDQVAMFERFWDSYPRKESKPVARKAFDKIKPDEELLSKMIESIDRWKQTTQWQENGGQFIPYPASWLNQRKWEDNPPVVKKKAIPANNFEQRDYSSVPDDDMAGLAAEMAAFLRGEETT